MAERDRKGRFRRKLKATPADTREWLIWSREWRAWHRRGEQGGANGYTDDISMAGLFTRSIAASYHDGIKDEAFHVSEKRADLRAALKRHKEALGRLNSALTTPEAP